MHMQMIKYHWFVHKVLSGNKILTITKGHNFVVNLRKLMCTNPNLDLVKTNTKLDQILSIHSQDIERTQNSENN